MYTSKSVSQRSAIFNPEEIQTDRVLFSLDRIFVKACQCRHSSPLGTFCVLRGEDRGFTAHSLIFRSRSSMPIIDVLLFLLEDFTLKSLCEKLHFRTRFQGIRFDGYLLVKKNRSES